jgi:hypothetical protein
LGNIRGIEDAGTGAGLYDFVPKLKLRRGRKVQKGVVLYSLGTGYQKTGFLWPIMPNADKKHISSPGILYIKQ